MVAVRSAKAVRKHEESSAVRTWDDAALEAGDRVLIASIDSFPASDPPGWIEVKAHPREDSPESR